MRFSTTVVLLIIAALIGCYIWFFERKQPSSREVEEKGQLLFRVKADEIERIEISTDGEPVVCAKDVAGNWRMEKPVKYGADRSTVRSISSRIENLNSQRIIRGEEIDEKKIEEFGLSKPRLTLKFRALGKDTGVCLGGDTPLGDNLYARIVGERDVRVIPKSAYAVFDKKPNDLRDRSVVDLEPEQIGRFSVSRAEGVMELAQDDGLWKLLKPVRGAADPDKVGGMLRKLKHLRVRDFVDDKPEDPGRYGLTKPVLEVTLWSKKDQSSRTVIFGKQAEKGAVYAQVKGADSVLSVGDDVLKELTKAPEDLRDLRVTHLAPGKIEEVRIEREDNKLVLTKRGEKWEISQPEAADADESRVREFLSTLTGLKATRVVLEKLEDPDSYGFGKGVVKVTLKPHDGEAETLMAGKKFASGKKVYLKRGAGDEVLEISSDFLDHCSPDVLRYMNRKITDFKSGDVKKISISAAGKPTVVLEKETEGKWQAVEPRKGEGDSAAVNVVLSNLSQLMARDLIERGPKDLKKYGLEKPALEVSFQLEKAGSIETKKILIGSKAKDEVFYARLDGGDIVFTLPSYVEANLRKDFTSRPPPEGNKSGQ